MNPRVNYAESRRERTSACSWCGELITRERYAANGNRPARWSTHYADTGQYHHCSPLPLQLPPPNERWWVAMCARADEQNESPTPLPTVQHPASRASQRKEPQAEDDSAGDFLQQYRGEL